MLIDALKQAETTVLEPIQRFSLDVPIDSLGDVLSALIVARALPQQTTTQGRSAQVTGTIPTEEIHQLEQRLPGLSQGEGMFTAEFNHYTEINGTLPSRARTDFNPLNRREYLARVSQG